MRKSISSRAMGLVMGLTVVLGVSLPASAGVDRAFRGHVIATIVLAVPEDDGVHLTVTGVGQATHMGNFTRVENLVLAGPYVTGDLTFTSQKGDTVTASVDGAFIAPGVAEGTCTITSGTGKFAGATGEYDFKAVAIGPGVFDVTFGGRINF